jgi:aminoglycoside phosphotransferase (APT) family kinase protein
VSAQPPVTVNDLRAVLGAVRASSDVDTLPVDRGSPERTNVFIVGDIVVKIDLSGAQRVARERAALEHLMTTDLPIPRYIGSGVLDDGREWIATTRLDGAAPPDAARPGHEISPGLAGQLGALTARLHAAPGPGYIGPATRRFDSYVEKAERQSRRMPDLGYGRHCVPRNELDDLMVLLDGTRPCLETAPFPARLVHGDVQPRNVLVGESGTITALIDFEVAGGGDPTEDFALVGLDWHGRGFAAFCEGYAEAGGRLDADAPARVAHHVARWALAVFVYLGSFAPTYLEPARRAVTRVRAGEVPDLGPAARP